MQSRKRFHIRERLRRIFFIKWELSSKIYKTMFKNKYLPAKISILSNLHLQRNQKNKYSITRHRIICPINSSFKIVNKDFRLSRFSLNNLAKENHVAGLLRRGW